MSDEDVQYHVFADPKPNDSNLQCQLLGVYLDESEKSPKDVNKEDYEEKCGTIFVSSKGEYILACEFCDTRFNEMSSFGHHLEMKHFSCEDEDPSMSAEITDLKIEVDEEVLSIGSTSKDNEYPIEYAEVPEEVLVQIDSKEFLKPDFEDAKLLCNICEKQFTSKITFARHKRQHKTRIANRKNRNTLKKDSKAINTSLASVLSKAEDDLSTHIDNPQTAAESPAENLDLYCDLCDQYFKTPRTFRKHAISRHGNIIPKALQKDPLYLKCRFCHEEFRKPLDRSAHESTHDEDTPFKCSYCPRWFRVKYQRDIHENTHTGAHPYKCPHCPRAFKSYINRVQHIRMHFNIKRFECEYCGFKFLTNVEKTIHVRIHTKEKPYQCEDCGQRFRVSGQLFRHRKRHYDQRDCECDICGAKFFSNYAVKKHKILHTDDRPFECDICGRKFQRKRTLVAHQQLHDPVKKYECSICGKRFAQRAGLHSHMKTHGEKAIEV